MTAVSSGRLEATIKPTGGGLLAYESSITKVASNMSKGAAFVLVRA